MLENGIVCVLENELEGEYRRGRESNSIILFGSFLRNEGEGFEGVWKGFNYL